MIIRILEPESFPEPALARMRQRHQVILGDERGDLNDRVEAVFIRLAQRIDSSFLQGYPWLRYVVTPTTGHDHLDQQALDARQVAVLSLRGRTEFLDHIHATAEHTLTLALGLLRDLAGADAAVRSGRWDRYPHKGRELFGKTVTILGYGRIGRQVETLYRAFGCRIQGHDSDPAKVPGEFRMQWPQDLAKTDILSIHLSLTLETESFVDAALLDLLPHHAIVVNTARGQVIDQEALLTRLEAGRIAGAALDVLAGEPQPLAPFAEDVRAALGRRLVITPHIAGFTVESLQNVETYITDRFLKQVSNDAG